jgi:streptogramin lyase
MFASGHRDPLRRGHRKSQDIGTRGSRRNDRFRRPLVEGLEARCLLSVTGPPLISELPVLKDGEPDGIATGPDGNLWFTLPAAGLIGRITPAGQVTDFSTGLMPDSVPGAITAGPDGNLWFTDGANTIGRITTGGQITEFSNGITPDSFPTSITAGPDGTLWFTEGLAGQIGCITPEGQVTEFSKGITPGSDPEEITAGPDGNLWFTQAATDQIGRITPAGHVTEFSTGITPNSFPEGITAGPDGNLWFTESAGRIGRITPAGHVTEVSTGITPDSNPSGITAGPDGNLWFTQAVTGQIGRITPQGQVTEFSAGITPKSEPDSITAGPDGNLWFTEDRGTIGRVDLPPTASGTSFNAATGQPFTGVVGTFTDLNPSATPGDYTTSISWGDGTTTAGQVSEGATGTFYITGTHTYAYPAVFGAFAIGIDITDEDGGGTAVSSTADVDPTPLLTTAVPVLATEGVPVPAGTLVATFINTGGVLSKNVYDASIQWGDGTAPVAATVVSVVGNFQVSSAQPHTYARAGRYEVQVTINGLFLTALAVDLANVADAPIMPVVGPQPPTQTQGTLLTGVALASFTVGDPSASPGDFVATIDWGDGTPTSIGTIAQPGGPGQAFTVTGDHTYVNAPAQPYTITVQIQDEDGESTTMTTNVTVAAAAPLASGIPVSMTQGIAFTAPVAYLLEPDGLPPLPAGDFTAMIAWGDGTASTAGTIEAIPGGDWVIGSHTYATSGPFTITVTVHDAGGLTVPTTTTAFDPPGTAPVQNAGSSTVPTANSASVPAAVDVPAGPLHHRHRNAKRLKPELHRTDSRHRAGSGSVAIPKRKLTLVDHHSHRNPTDRGWSAGPSSGEIGPSDAR